MEAHNPAAGDLAWSVPTPRPECGEAPLDPDPSRHPLAEDGAGPGRVGDEPEERQLRDETNYHHLGGRYIADRDVDRVKQHLLRRLRAPGVDVEVKAA